MHISTYLKSLGPLLILLAVSLIAVKTRPADASNGSYPNFKTLSKQEDLKKDYTIVRKKTSSSILVMAIHGGKIEPGTSEIGTMLSTKLQSCLYTFNGIKIRDNMQLHISSTQFDEPFALDMARQATFILSIHGCKGAKSFLYVSGKDKKNVQYIRESLTAEGFLISPTPKEMYGTSPANICNKNSRKKGVQIELSKGLRDQMHTDPKLLNKFTNAIADTFIDTNLID